MKSTSFRINRVSNQVKGVPQLSRIISHKNNVNKVTPHIHHFENTQYARPFIGGGDNDRAQSRTIRQSAPLAPLSANIDFDADQSTDEFLKQVEQLPLYLAIESYLKIVFDAQAVIYWQEVSSLQSLYSPSMRQMCPHTEGIVGNTFFTRQMTSAMSGPEHPSFSEKFDSRFCPSMAPIMAFTLSDYTNSTCGVCLVIKPVESQGFSKMNEVFAAWFARKFRTLSRWIKPLKIINEHLLDITQIQRTDQFLKVALPKIEAFFNCRAAEIWKLDREGGEIICYSKNITRVEEDSAGIAGSCLRKGTTINCVNCQLHASYNSLFDGSSAESVLAVPVEESETNTVYSVVLRGQREGLVFNSDDEENLKKLVVHYALALENSNAFTMADDEFQHAHMERESLTALLEVAELLGEQRDKDQLILTIMEKGRQLTNAERCALFIVNESKDRLITSFQNGLDNAISIPINKGIAGRTYMDKTIMNIVDAYDNAYFDSTTDKESGFRTRSILSVPIFNNRSEVIGVTEMVNKNTNKPFTQWDADVIQIFNVFAGISLENVSLYKEAHEKGEQLRSLLNISFSLAKFEDIQRILNDILTNARKTINAQCASLFLVDETNNCLSSLVYDGGSLPPSIPLTSGVAAMCAKSKQGLIENDVYHSPQFNRTIDISTGFKTRSLLACPVLSGNDKLIGVVELVNKESDNFNSKDMEIVQRFATFSAVAIENNRLKDLAMRGSAEVEMSKWIGESERSSYSVPSKLRLQAEEEKLVISIKFFSPDFKGINHIKEVFYLFTRFGILDTFKISAERFFRFIFKIRSTYNDVPYHNWMHACDVTSYASYELVTSGFDKLLTPLEKFAFLLSAISHDANHEGFNNIFNIKAQTPFGILFKDTSVMETHHITVLIDIMSEEPTNLFCSLNENELKKMWNMIIKLILATDMAKHFEMIKRMNADYDEGNFSLNKEEDRLEAMCLLIKVADISNVSRPFPIADKWCDILNQEFFRQGDLEKSTGIGLTSPLNDRENPDKPKSQIGFYNFVCLPLYNLVAKIFPDLSVNAESVQSNLAVWMSLAEKKKKEEEQAANNNGSSEEKK